MHIGEAEAAALVLVGEFRVVDAQQVQDGGLQVVDVDRAGDNRSTNLHCHSPRLPRRADTP